MAIYERGGGFELGRTGNKSSKWSERDLNPVPLDIDSDTLYKRHSATLPSKIVGLVAKSL